MNTLAETGRCTTAVSYTHLDVYKRQMFVCVRARARARDAVTQTRVTNVTKKYTPISKCKLYFLRTLLSASLYLHND